MLIEMKSRSQTGAQGCDHEAQLRSIQIARKKLRRVREMLLAPTPAVLQDCLPCLQEAASLLTGLESSLRDYLGKGNSPELLLEVKDFRTDLSHVTQLVSHAVQFYAEWAQILSTNLGGYGAGGMAAPLEARSRFGCDG